MSRQKIPFEKRYVFPIRSYVDLETMEGLKYISQKQGLKNISLLVRIIVERTVQNAPGMEEIRLKNKFRVLTSKSGQIQIQ